MIDTKAKGLRRSLPEDFAYFHVEFGLSGGFAHLIEDEKSWPQTWGQDILGGLLEMDPEQVLVCASLQYL